jgi:hypothetical protein
MHNVRPCRRVGQPQSNSFVLRTAPCAGQQAGSAPYQQPCPRHGAALVAVALVTRSRPLMHSVHRHQTSPPTSSRRPCSFGAVHARALPRCKDNLTLGHITAQKYPNDAGIYVHPIGRIISLVSFACLPANLDRIHACMAPASNHWHAF